MKDSSRPPSRPSYAHSSSTPAVLQLKLQQYSSRPSSSTPARTPADHNLPGLTGSPYFNVFDGKIGKTPKDMVEELKKLEIGKLNTFPWYFRLNNSQAYDFNYVEDIRSNFDFILVLERLQESLIILKHRC